METSSLWDDIGEAFDGAVLRTATGLWSRSDGVGILYPGMTNIFYGESESGKTMGALAAALQICRDGGLVFFLDYEMTIESVTMRLKSLGATREIAPNFMYKMWPEPGSKNDGFGTLKRRIADIIERAAALPEDGPGAVVVIDSVDEFLYSVGVHPNDQDAGTVMRGLLAMPLNEAGVTLVLIDHSSTSQQGREKKGPAGSYRKLANVDAAIKFKVVGRHPSPGQRARVEMFVDKDRAGTLRAMCPEQPSTGTRSHFGTMIVDSRDDPDFIQISVEPGTAKAKMTNQDAVLLYMFDIGATSKEKAIHYNEVHVRWETEAELNPVIDEPKKDTVRQAVLAGRGKEYITQYGSTDYLSPDGVKRCKLILGNKE